ncbi:hypothetical protein GBQ70_02325 [Halomicrobium sp. ZPS1]|uniref:Type II toxin-antitoxin system HicA family toxin n=1 Tax=Halomicrobium mukohataei TaxID=57705 RepID=A0A4D6KNG1_9EURY|nr:type II toxin-antitoxin system HicA family toxin [Halomicrobium mukohataei]QFR21873.1 hypothetical protein GBQ70_02325 [Halomicrobium sp. ZPS1]
MSRPPTNTTRRCSERELTTVEAVHDDGSYTCTVRDSYGECDEVIVVPCEDDRRQVTVPLHDEVPIGTLRDIAGGAGANDFESFCDTDGCRRLPSRPHDGVRSIW